MVGKRLSLGQLRNHGRETRRRNGVDVRRMSLVRGFRSFSCRATEGFDWGNLGFSPFTVSFLEIGSSYDASIAGGTPGGLLTQFELTVNGIPWGIPAGGDASVSFSAVLPVNDGSLEVTQPFSFEGSFTGAPEPFAPGLGCDVLHCQTLNFSGGGIVTFGLWPYVGGPPAMVLEQETFNFGVAPEPSTASLLLLGFAGLALLGWRGKPRATLIPLG